MKELLKTIGTSLLECLNDSKAIASLTPEGIIEHANSHYLKIFNFNENELVGKNHKTLLDSELCQGNTYSDFWKKLSSGQSLSGEFKRISKSGSEIWIYANYFPILNKKGSLLRVIEFAVDLTSSKLQSFHTSQQISALNRSTAVAQFDTSGNLLDVNENFCQIFAYRPEELIGQHHSKLIFSQDNNQSYKDFWKTLREGNFSSGEFRRKNRLGNEVWIRGTYNPIYDSKGKIHKILKFALDVTKQKKTQEELTKEKLARSNQSKLAALGQMAAGIAHEINNPLAVMSTKIEESLFDLNQNINDPECIKTNLNSLQTHLERINKIIKSLKGYSSNLNSQLSPLPVKKILDDVLLLSSQTLRNKKIDFKTKGDINRVLNVDMTLASQILVNLISNSTQAMIEAQTHDKFIEIEVLDGEEESLCSILYKDSGPGIPLDIAEKIFDPFFTTKGPNGTGLGLSLCATNMKKMGGEIFFRPEITPSCFELKFKIQASNQQKAAS